MNPARRADDDVRPSDPALDPAVAPLLTRFVTMVGSDDAGPFRRHLDAALAEFAARFDLAAARVRLGELEVATGPLTEPVLVLATVDRPDGPPAVLEGTAGRRVGDVTRAYAQALLGTAVAVADRIAVATALAHAADHDELTGLLNRSAFVARLAAAVEAHPGALLTVALVDVDRLTAVNATFGDAAGDAVLKVVAERLRAGLRRGPDDDVVLGRLGADEFAALLPVDTDPAAAARLAAEVVEAVGVPIEVEPGSAPAVTDPALPRLPSVERAEVVRTVTLGLASARARLRADAELLWCATQATTVGKRQGGARAVVYDSSMRRADEIRGEVEMRLPRAIADDEFVLYFQPEVDLRTTEVLGAEALVRWNHPTLGLLLPDTFIETVETSSYALRFGRWVLEHACRRWAAWAEQFGWDAERLPRVRVNVSPSQLMAEDFVRTVAAVLAATGLPGNGLGLEITERDVVRDRVAAQRTLRGLADLGVTVAIDDFGTGYSSFGQLRHFSVSALKIDRRFVAHLPVNRDDRSIVAAVLSLAESLGLEVVAEGIQDPEAARVLVEMGCRRGQGFLYGRPQPAELIEPVLANGRIRTPA